MIRFLTSMALFAMFLAGTTGCHTTTSNRVPQRRATRPGLWTGLPSPGRSVLRREPCRCRIDADRPPAAVVSLAGASGKRQRIVRV